VKQASEITEVFRV